MKNNNISFDPTDDFSLSSIHQLYAKALTKSAAIACHKWIGRGDEKAADQAAVTAMRNTFNHLNIDGRIVIGEGERDKAPMLYIGEQVGSGGKSIDIAVDPLEGTTICARSMPNSISVLALAARGGLLHAPDVYMEKIAVGPNLPHGLVDLNNTLKQNLRALAKAKKCELPDLNICILNRKRHCEIIATSIELGARVTLIDDGDVSAVIATCLGGAKVDMYYGTGGAPEGVIAAAALKCLNGQMQGRLLFDNDDEKQRAKKAGITDYSKIYTINDMVPYDTIFCASGVTTGWMLKGVRSGKRQIKTSHLIMHYNQGYVGHIDDIDLIRQRNQI